jgi:hypothetical protein
MKLTGEARDAFLVSLLGVYSAQYASYTTLLWQVPALSLGTGQMKARNSRLVAT